MLRTLTRYHRKFRNFLVLAGFLYSSFDHGPLQWCVLVNQSVEVDCEDHVVHPAKFLEPCDSNQSAVSLTLHENDAVHVQLTSGTSSSNREEERPPEPITGFGSGAGTTNCDASGLGGFARRYHINQESEDNIELLPLYHVPCVTLCHCLVKQHSRNDKKKSVLRVCPPLVFSSSSFSFFFPPVFLLSLLFSLHLLASHSPLNLSHFFSLFFFSFSSLSYLSFSSFKKKKKKKKDCRIPQSRPR